jgi:hypothetical protein
MKTLAKILLSLVLLVVVAGLIVYGIGMTLPVNHSTSRTDIINAPPDKVFALITNIPAQPTWRKGVQRVEILPPKNGGDHWREDLGHNQFMTFTATKTDTPIHREVLLDDPGASYGGTWTYELAPTGADATTLTITEAGFIHPPLYRFMMHHVIGMTHNIDQYFTDIKAAAQKS